MVMFAFKNQKIASRWQIASGLCGPYKAGHTVRRVACYSDFRVCNCLS